MGEWWYSYLVKIFIYIFFLITSLSFSASSSENVILECTCKNILWKNDNVVVVNDCGSPPDKENHTLVLDKNIAWMVYGGHAYFFKNLENNIITAEGLDMTEDKIYNNYFKYSIK